EPRPSPRLVRGPGPGVPRGGTDGRRRQRRQSRAGCALVRVPRPGQPDLRGVAHGAGWGRRRWGDRSAPSRVRLSRTLARGPGRVVSVARAFDGRATTFPKDIKATINKTSPPVPRCWAL